jgi:hypothetical protein
MVHPPMAEMLRREGHGRQRQPRMALWFWEEE